ncbi:MAG: ABC transporter substrate-binding protein, partial [Candidatus Dormibacteraeota bacterium]|nr:ABC transporter substrate-binding protein [Candidatus Dormibacteraeota bacterium]
DSSNPWVTLFKGIKTQYAPSLPWDGNVLYGMAQAYTFVQALTAAGQNPSRDDLVHAIQNGHWSGPGLVNYGYSASSHLGFLGVEIIKTNADGSQTALGSVQTTDDTQSGAITQYSGAVSQPPSNGIPSD